MKTLCSHKPLPAKLESSPSVGDIFREYGPAFRAKHRLHPHIHFIVTAGGINTQGGVEPKYSSTFLFPVRALSNVFRAKFLNGLIAAHAKGLLKLSGDLARLSPHGFRRKPRVGFSYNRRI